MSFHKSDSRTPLAPAEYTVSTQVPKYPSHLSTQRSLSVHVGPCSSLYANSPPYRFLFVWSARIIVIMSDLIRYPHAIAVGLSARIDIWYIHIFIALTVLQILMIQSAYYPWWLSIYRGVLSCDSSTPTHQSMNLNRITQFIDRSKLLYANQFVVCFDMITNPKVARKTEA